MTRSSAATFPFCRLAFSLFGFEASFFLLFVEPLGSFSFFFFAPIPFLHFSPFFRLVGMTSFVIEHYGSSPPPSTFRPRAATGPFLHPPLPNSCCCLELFSRAGRTGSGDPAFFFFFPY